MDPYFKYIFKYIIIGNPSVGKSSILNQFLNNKFFEEYEITVGVEFGAKTIQLSNQDKIKLQIWDTAGQEGFKSITRAYYRAAAVAVVVYDISSLDSFQDVESWLEECKEHGNSDMTLILVANKTDMEDERIVSPEEGKSLADKFNMLFIETSAKNAININEIFITSAECVNKKIIEEEIDPKNENFGIKLGTTFLDSNNETEFKIPKAKKKCCN